MPYTSPYQKTVTIHRSPLDKNFLGINNDSWKTAARILTPPSFLLYIYFASNKDKFTLALSPKAIQQEIGINIIDMHIVWDIYLAYQFFQNINAYIINIHNINIYHRNT